MDTISYTAVRANLAKMMETVCNNHSPLIITRNGDPVVVMLSHEDYLALEESAYLLRNPANRQRLEAGVQPAVGQTTPTAQSSSGFGANNSSDKGEMFG